MPKVVKTIIGTFNFELAKRFKKKTMKTLKWKGVKTFYFEGRQVFIGFAKHMVEYLENEFPELKEYNP